MRFKQHYLALSVNERELLATKAGTTRGTLNQIIYGNKQIELGLADCLVALCRGLTLDDFPLTDRAKQQQVVRTSVGAQHKQRSTKERRTSIRREADQVAASVTP